MLRRAATNAYSWWWASHIRTKQSKWLEQSLQDMEQKVEDALRIIDDNGDSFSQRAEMYYRKRPELLIFVEEAFRAYRALAERYDHLSKELQSANRTIASVFPEQVHYRIEDEDDGEEGCFPEPANSSSPDHNNQIQKSEIPKAPDIPKKIFRSQSMLLSRKRPLRKSPSSIKSVTKSSGLSEAEALAEIDKLQKEILALQTEKEFVRSLYERSYEKYWEIEESVTGMQNKICSLQDEFRVNTIIDDNDARTLMAATALNSCKETLAKLQEAQSQSSEEAKAAYKRVKEAHEKFEALRDQFISKHSSLQGQGTEEEASLEEDMHEHDVTLLREKIKEKLEEEDSANSLTMTEMTEKIDELVSKVFTLETAISSQNALVKRLRSEADELQKNIQSLEEDNEMLIEDSEVTKKKLKELEEELRRVKVLNQNVKRQDNSLQEHFTEASCNLEHLSGKLNDVKLDEEGENFILHKMRSSTDGKLKEKSKGNLAIFKDVKTTNDCSENLGDVPNEDDKLNFKENIESLNVGNGEEEDPPDWKHMFVSGIDDREKVLLDEYTSVLKNYKDVRVKLNDVEKKNRDSIFELALQVRELKNTVAIKDKEIYSLQQKLTYSETNPGESPGTPLTEYKYTPQETLLENTTQESNTQDPEIPSSKPEASPVSTSLAEQHQEVEKTENVNMSPGNMRLVRLIAKQVDKNHSLSTLEKKFRLDIDYLLEENLEFWLRFSTSVHQIQKFQNSIQDLKAELRKIKDNNSSEGNSNSTQSDKKAIYRHVREIRSELSLWLEHNTVLQEELQARHPLLCSLQDEIARAANPNSVTEKAELSGYQAAKFQGEVLNMKQEINKVSSELQAGLSFVKGLKSEVEKLLQELSQAIGVNNQGYDHDQMKHSSSRARIPLRSFLFGIKLKKQRQSVFSCVNPQFSDQAAENYEPI